MKSFLITFSAVLLAILAAVGILHFIRNPVHHPDKLSQPQISAEEARARRVDPSMDGHGHLYEVSVAELDCLGFPTEHWSGLGH